MAAGGARRKKKGRPRKSGYGKGSGRTLTLSMIRQKPREEVAEILAVRRASHADVWCDTSRAQGVCGVVSVQTGKMCANSQRCPAHNDQQRAAIRAQLLGSAVSASRRSSLPQRCLSCSAPSRCALS